MNKVREHFDKHFIEIQPKKMVDLMDVAKRAMEHKREALGGEGRLYVSNYFAVPNLPKEVKEGIKKLEEKERLQRKEDHVDAIQSSGKRLKRRIPDGG